MHNLAVVNVPLHTLSQHPDNPHNGDIDAIAASMEANGIFQPILVQTSTRYIIAGNHRYAAALKLGLVLMPAIFLDVSNAEARRMMVADNRTAQLGWEDEALLANLLDSIYKSDQGFHGTGYDLDDYSKLMELIDTPMAPDEVLRDVAEPDSTAVDEPVEKRELRYRLEPTVNEDGKAYSLTMSKDSGRPITANDVNMLRKALGMDPLSQDELDRANVPSWRR